MKITFLLVAADDASPESRRTLRQAAELTGRHQVEVLSVLRTAKTPPDSPVQVRFLVDATGPTPRPERSQAAPSSAWAELAARPSTQVPPHWEPRFHRLAELELERALRELRTDVLVTGGPALLAPVRQAAPAQVWTVHQEHRVPERRPHAGIEPLLRHAPGLDALVVPAEAGRRWLLETLEEAAPEIAVVPATPPSGYRPTSTLRTGLVLLVADLVAEAQIEQALTAWAELAAEFPEWVLRVIGNGPQLRALRTRAEHLRLGYQVQFLPAAPDLTNEWAKASLALSTAAEDADGAVLLDAQAAGVPVVAYACPHAPAEIVSDGHDGLLLPQDDVAGLTAALRLLMSDAELRGAMGAAALDSADRRAAAHPAAPWEELLGRLAASAVGGGREEARLARLTAHELAAVLDGAVAAEPGAPTRLRKGRQRALEAEILKRQPQLISQGGQLYRPLEWQSPFDQVQSNLALVADALDAADIPYAVVRDSMVRHTVAVHADFRGQALKALADAYLREPVYVALLDAEQKPVVTGLAGAAMELEPMTGSALRVHRNALSPSRTLRLGQVYGCTVAFWEDDPEGAPLFHSPTATAIGTKVPQGAMAPGTLTLGGRDYPTTALFTRPFYGDVDFPVDVVYTWVDGADLAWAERKQAALAELGVVAEDAATSAARFRNRDELRYSLRSLDMYTPWVRTIYLVTDRQVPSWLDASHPRIRVVDHSEIFGSAGRLPTYNSHAIESRLHHIDGLSEHFLYFNDDVFVGRPVRPDLFFEGNGQARFFMSANHVPMLAPEEATEYSMAGALNNRALIAAAFGQVPVRSFVHAPHPLRRSVLAELEQRFPEEFEATASHQLRSLGDLSVASSLHHYYGYYTHRSVAGRINAGFVNVGLRVQRPKLNRILAARPHDTFCLNDFPDGDVSEDEQDSVLRAFLPSYFPIASQFERGSDRNRRHYAGRLPRWPL